MHFGEKMVDLDLLIFFCRGATRGCCARKQARLPSTPGRLGYFSANAGGMQRTERGAAGLVVRIQLNTTTA